MSFISYNNNITLEDIDLETNLIGVQLNDKYLAYSGVGGRAFKMDYDCLVGAYVDSSHDIKLALSSEYSHNIDDNTLSALEYNREFVIEQSVQQIYIEEMGQ